MISETPALTTPTQVLTPGGPPRNRARLLRLRAALLALAVFFSATAVVSTVDHQDAAALDLCTILKNQVWAARHQLARRWIDLRMNYRDLPLTGRMSVEGHRQQYNQARNTLNNAFYQWVNDFCGPPGGGFGLPNDLATWQRTPAPYPMSNGRWNGHPRTTRTTGSVAPTNNPNAFAWVGAAAGTAAVALWWVGKGVAPACGPAAPICAIVL